LISSRRRQGGQELVEFAVVAPILFFLALAVFDLVRVVQIANATAEGARQGARQAAANALAADQPFGSYSGACSGTATTANATGTGCLTDSAIVATVNESLGSFVAGSTLYGNTSPSNCPTPSAGYASICTSPAEAVRGVEWAVPTQQGSFMVVVTVVVRYSPMIPMVAGAFPAVFKLVSSTTTLTEY
jgi:Flp pilus assembly protein TadG